MLLFCLGLHNHFHLPQRILKITFLMFCLFAIYHRHPVYVFKSPTREQRLTLDTSQHTQTDRGGSWGDSSME